MVRVLKSYLGVEQDGEIVIISQALNSSVLVVSGFCVSILHPEGFDMGASQWGKVGEVVPGKQGRAGPASSKVFLMYI